jgi:hypothetical protein
VTTTPRAGSVALSDSGPPHTPSNEDFYAEFTARNAGLIDPREQELLRDAAILVAGCGSIGGAVVEPLVRLGAEHFMLAEPDSYELHNLNRQHATVADIGHNKAVVLARAARAVNPYAQVEVDERGVVAENMTERVSEASLIVDGVDVTSAAALACKYALHVAAHDLGVPVVSGYDIAGVQLVLVYDYRLRSLPVLDGRLSGQPVDDLDPLWFLARVVPLRALPVEIFPVLRRQLAGGGEPFPQLVYSARLFGAIAARVAVDLLSGRPVRKRIVVDAHRLSRPLSARCRLALVRWRELARMSRTALRYRNATPAATVDMAPSDGRSAS